MAGGASDGRPAGSVAAMGLVLPATTWIEPGARHRAGAEAVALGRSRALLVTDAFMVQSGVAAEIVAGLEDAGLAVAVFDGVEPDPTDAAVDEGRAALVVHEADVVVAALRTITLQRYSRLQKLR